MFMIPLGFIMLAVFIYILVSNSQKERKLIKELRANAPVRRVTIDSVENANRQ